MLFFWIFNTANGNGIKMSNANEYEIRFDELNEKIYIRAKSWGLAGNHQEIILSNSPITNQHNEYFKDRQFTFLNSTELYYKTVGMDTLEIYIDLKVNVPENFSSKVKIKQIELSPKESRDYAENYADNGLTKVSVYQSKE